MSLVSLTNPGLIPMEAVTTMGVSAKEGDNPIGMFGTGLKYAIASLLRTSQKITIWRGLERYDFATEQGEVRGKEFSFIRMSGPEGEQRLGFTTHLGAHWETWQVFRELYSNCLDEAGDIAFTRVEPRDGHTTIWVTGETFADAARSRHLYFLSSKPIYSGSSVEIHEGPGAGIYFRGVLVAGTEKRGAYTYNVTTSLGLTEDRTLKDGWLARYYIGQLIADCTDRAILERILVNRDGYESTLTFEGPGVAFAETALELSERLGVASVIGAAVKAAEQWAQREARVKEAKLSRLELAEIEDATDFLERIGYPVEAPITVAETLGPGVFGMTKNGRIYLSRATINRGGNFLIGTILEEHLHVSQGLRDESRDFQDFLVDLVVRFAKDADRHTASRPAYDPANLRPARALEEVPF